MTSGIMTPTESVVIANIMNIRNVSHLIRCRLRVSARFHGRLEQRRLP